MLDTAPLLEISLQLMAQTQTQMKIMKIMMMNNIIMNYIQNILRGRELLYMTIRIMDK